MRKLRAKAQEELGEPASRSLLAAPPVPAEPPGALLEDIFVGFHVPAFTRNLRKNLLSTPRFHLFDPGIRHASSGMRTLRPVLFGGVARDPTCILLIREGASRVSPDLPLEAADDGLAATGLMRQLSDDGWSRNSRGRQEPRIFR